MRKWLLLGVAWLLLGVLPGEATTLTGTVNYPNSVGLTGKIYFTLSQQAAQLSAGGCGGPVVLVPTQSVSFGITAGAIAGGAAVVGNDCIAPAGTYYIVQVLDTLGNILFTQNWIVTGTTIDIGTIQPVIVPQGTVSIGTAYVTNLIVGGSCTGCTVGTGVTYMGTGAGQFTHLQAAHDALPATGGTIILTPNYIDIETATVNITKGNVSVICQNTMHGGDSTDTQIVFNHAAVGINVTGAQFGIDGCHLKVGTNTTRVGIPMVDSNTTLGGRLSNILVTGQGGNPNNGIFFRSADTNTRQGIWQLNNIFNRDGNTWTSIITVSIASASLTGAYYQFSDIVNSDSEKYTDAAIVLDGTIDTVIMDRVAPGNAYATTPKTLWLRNTVSSSGNGYPRWVHCSNCYLEAGAGNGVFTGTAIQIDSGRDVDYWGYIASAQNAVNVTGSLVGVNIHDTAFTNMYGTAIAVTGGTGVTVHHNNFASIRQGAISYAGGGGIVIDGNTFYDSGNQTTNTYDTVSIVAATGNVQVTNNSWLNQTANKPRYGINFLGSESGIVVSGNNYITAIFGTAFLNAPTSGSNFQVQTQGSLIRTVDAYGSLQAAHDSLPAAGGTIFVPGSSTPFGAAGTTAVAITKPVHVIFDCGSFTYSGSATQAINNTSRGVIVEGCGRRGDDTTTVGTTLTITNTATNGILNTGPGATYHDFNLIGPASGTGLGILNTAGRAEYRNLNISSFGSDGWTNDGTSVNSNTVLVEKVRSSVNGGNGFVTKGSNGQLVTFLSTDGSANTGDGYNIANQLNMFEGTNADTDTTTIGYHFVSGGSNNIGHLDPDSNGKILFDSGANNNTLFAVAAQSQISADNGTGNAVYNVSSSSWFTQTQTTNAGDHNYNLNLNSGTGGTIRGASINLQDNGANKWTIQKSTANNFVIADPGILNRFQMNSGSVTEIESGGTQDVRINDIAVAATGTGGLSVYSGGAASVKVAGIDGGGVTSVKRVKTNFGTQLVAGDFVLSAGWGTTAAVTAITGTDAGAVFTVTANGTGIAANPTITLTFHDGTWTNVPLVVSKQVGGTGQRSDVTDAPTATTWVGTYIGTPVAGSTYIFGFLCQGVS